MAVIEKRQGRDGKVSFRARVRLYAAGFDC